MSPPSGKAAQYAEYCNATYSAQHHDELGKLGTLENPRVGPRPQAHISIITCMDARIDPFRMFNLSLGEAHVIRVGGGRVPDALRSLVVSQQVLGTKEVMVVHHTDCGFSHAESLKSAYKEIREGLGGVGVDHVPLMLIGKGWKGVEESVRDDVRFLRDSPYVKKQGEPEALVSGWVYETFSGKLKFVC